MGRMIVGTWMLLMWVGPGCACSTGDPGGDSLTPLTCVMGGVPFPTPEPWELYQPIRPFGKTEMLGGDLESFGPCGHLLLQDGDANAIVFSPDLSNHWTYPFGMIESGFAPTGELLQLVGSDDKVRLIDLRDGSVTHELVGIGASGFVPTRDGRRSLHYSCQDATGLAVVDRGMLRMIEVPGILCDQRTVGAGQAPVVAFAVADGTIEIVDLESNEQVSTPLLSETGRSPIGRECWHRDVIRLSKDGRLLWFQGKTDCWEVDIEVSYYEKQATLANAISGEVEGVFPVTAMLLEIPWRGHGWFWQGENAVYVVEPDLSVRSIPGRWGFLYRGSESIIARDWSMIASNRAVTPWARGILDLRTGAFEDLSRWMLDPAGRIEASEGGQVRAFDSAICASAPCVRIRKAGGKWVERPGSLYFDIVLDDGSVFVTRGSEMVLLGPDGEELRRWPRPSAVEAGLVGDSVVAVTHDTAFALELIGPDGSSRSLGSANRFLADPERRRLAWWIANPDAEAWIGSAWGMGFAP